MNEEQFRRIDQKLESIISKNLAKFRSTAVSTTGVFVNAGRGKLGRINLVNTNASIVYVKFYDTVGVPNPASDLPVLTIPLPGSIGANVLSTFLPLNTFLNNIYVRVCTGIADTDNTAAGAAPIIELEYN